MVFQPLIGIFTDVEEAPTATTTAASGVTGTEATLNGTAGTGGGPDATATFEYYATSAGSGAATTTAADQNPVTSASGTSVSATVTGLSANTEYTVEVISTTDEGTTRGGTQAFTTANTAPAFTQSTSSESVAENNTGVLFDFEANDGDGGAGDTSVSYSLGGTDAGAFSITASGELSFTSAPDFENPTDGDTNNDYSVDVIADDGESSNNTTTAAVTVSVTDVNEAPTLSLGATSGSMDENNSPPTAVTTVTVNDDALGTNSLSLSGADAGAFNINGSDELEFTATADFEAKTSYDVTVEVNDSDVGTDPDDTASFSLSINDVNEAPVATGDDFTGGSGTDEDTPLTVSTRSDGVLPNDTDEDDSNADLSVAGVEGGSGNTGSTVTLASGATVTVASNGTFTYDPNGAFENLESGDNATDSFNYTTEDDGGAVSSNATVTVQINGVNDAPTIAGDQSLSTSEGTGVTLAGADLDGVDPDDGPSGLTYTVTSTPSNGEVRVGGTQTSSFTEADLDNGDVTYVHNDSETTSDAFDVELADGGEDGASAATATIDVSITLQNDDPTIATNTGSTVDEGTNDLITQSELETTDPEQNPAGLTYTIDTDVQNGQIVNTATSTQLDQGATFTQANINSGDIEYRHDGSETTADAFDFKVADGNGGSANGTFDVSVSPQNDAPVANADDFIGGSGTDEDTPLTVSTRSDGVLPNDTDEDDSNADLSVAGVEGSSGNVGSTVTITSGATVTVASNGTFTYDPNGQFEALGSGDNATDSFNYTTGDDDGAVSASSATVTVQISGVNDAPSIVGDQSLSVDEGAGVTLADTDLDGVDPDDSPSGLTYSVTSAPSTGEVRVAGTQASSFTEADLDNGDVTYVHDDSETGSDAFDVELADGGEDGASSATATIDVMISIDTTPEVSITDGSTAGLNVPARLRPGTDNNPLGVFSLEADRAGASLDGVTVTNSAPDTEGITRARLFWSTDKHLDVGTDTELDRVAINPSDAPQTISFGGFSQSIPTAARYVIVAVDVAPGVTAEAVQLTLAQTADLQTPGGEIETVNGTPQTTFSDRTLSNGTTRLPLRLSDFGATVVQNGGSTEREQIAVGDRVVRVTWQAADEQDNKGFEVQRKQAGASTTAWTKVGFIESTSSGSVRANGPDKSAKAATEYRFNDVVAFTSGSLEYRLRQESTDGSASFYKPATVTSESVQEVQLLGTFPNPARNQATVRFAVPEGKAADVTLRLYDLLGRQVQTVRRAADAGRHELQLDVRRLSSGVYFLRLGADGTFKTQKITVVR